MSNFFEKVIFPLIAWSFLALSGFWKDFLDGLGPLFTQSGQAGMLGIFRILLPSPTIWIIEIIIILVIIALVYLLPRK